MRPPDVPLLPQAKLQVVHYGPTAHAAQVLHRGQSNAYFGDSSGAAEMLRALHIPRVRLLTNNPEKIAGLAACGIEVVGRVRHAFVANGVNDGYLETKALRFGHLLK